MEKRFLLAGFVVLASCFLMLATGFCETIIVENSEEKVPIIIKKKDIAMVPIPMVGDKPENACQGWMYGTYQTTTENALKVNRIVIEPKGKIGTHEGPTDYVCVVTEGEGVLALVDGRNKPSATFRWKPGDVIVFKPNTLHRWDNGDKRTVMIGIEMVP